MSDRFKLVSVLDEAINTEGMLISEMREYQETRDHSLIERHILPGKKPTIFHCREVPRRVWGGFVQAGISESDRYARAFLCGVVEVENLRQDDGRVLDSWRPHGRTEMSMLDDADLERFTPSDVEEIGAAIYMRSFLGRRIGRGYRLPHMSLSCLGHRKFRLAEPSQSEPAPSSEKASLDNSD